MPRSNKTVDVCIIVKSAKSFVGGRCPLRVLSVVDERKNQRKKGNMHLIDVYFVKVNQLVMTIATFY